MSLTNVTTLVVNLVKDLAWEPVAGGSASFGRSRKIAAIAVFAALAAVIRIQSKVLSFPFPMVPSLKFEIWEVPVVLGLLLYGPAVGFTSGGIVLIIGLFIGSNLTGQFYNFIAFSSMMIGITVVSKLYSRSRNFKISRSTLVSTLGGIMVRVAVQVPLMLILLPLPPPLGFNLPLWSKPELLRTWVIGLVIFNTAVAAYTVPIAYGVEEALVKRITATSWIRLPLMDNLGSVRAKDTGAEKDTE